MASADQSNLNWIRNNQRKLRADLYSGFQDHMAHDGGVDMENVGRCHAPNRFGTVNMEDNVNIK